MANCFILRKKQAQLWVSLKPKGRESAYHETIMGYFRLDHASFGKTKNKSGAAGKNIVYNQRSAATELTSHAENIIAYNARDEVTSAVRSHIIPTDDREAKKWFLEQERADRKNARMLDRMIMAFPRSFSLEQCIKTAEDFCKTVTQNKVPWHFGIHYEADQKGKDDWNPHVHIGIRDRHIETGRRYLYTRRESSRRHPHMVHDRFSQRMGKHAQSCL